MTSCCKLCKLDWNKEYCLGCGRTVDEIRLAYINSLDKRSIENGTSPRPLSANKDND